MDRPAWLSDLLIVVIYGIILAILSVVNIRTLQQTYEQTERLQSVNQFLDCLDPTTPCGKKVAEQQAIERAWLIDTMRSQAVCTLLTSRTVLEHNDAVELEQIYNDCVIARTRPQPTTPPESPVEKSTGKTKK